MFSSCSIILISVYISFVLFLALHFRHGNKRMMELIFTNIFIYLVACFQKMYNNLNSVLNIFSLEDNENVSLLKSRAKW